jgi:GPH family glycoside/pentoside/hexuronide:cation symporter
MVTDPMIGFFSDRTRTRWGRRKPFMLFGSLFAGPTFAIIFSGVNQGDSASIILVIISYSLCAIFFTFFTIPYIVPDRKLGISSVRLFIDPPDIVS